MGGLLCINLLPFFAATYYLLNSCKIRFFGASTAILIHHSHTDTSMREMDGCGWQRSCEADQPAQMLKSIFGRTAVRIGENSIQG